MVFVVCYSAYEHRANVQNPTLKVEHKRSYSARNAEKLKKAAKTLYGDRNKASRAAYRADPEKRRLLVELSIEQSLKRRGQLSKAHFMHSLIERRVSFVHILLGSAVLG